MMHFDKKLNVLRVLDVLKEKSDAEHPLTQADIVRILEGKGVPIERKSVAANINSLIDYGYEIFKHEKGGYYFANREFEACEIKFMIDAIAASRNVYAKHAKDLIDKLLKGQSAYQRRKQYYIFRDDANLAQNTNFFYNIDVIIDAIEQKKKIKFKYNKYDVNKKLVPRLKDFYIINPYYLLNSNGRYYLVCNREGYEGISNYRIDYITDIKITDEAITPEDTFTADKNKLDMAKYASENTYMFGDKSVKVTLKLADAMAVTYIIDWFGKNAFIFTKENDGKTEYYANLTVSESTIVYWAMQFSQSVEIISPPETRARIAKLSKENAAKYSD